jgi:hypothetical protein
MGPLGNTVGRQAQFFASQILPLLFGGDPIGSVPTAGNMVNKVAEFSKNLTTPGGSVIDPMKILNIVLAEAQKTGQSEQTILSSLFNGQTMGDQRSTMSGIVNDLANWTPNPMYATALRNWVTTQGGEALRQASQAINPYTKPLGTFLTTGPNAGILPR